jgi:hypothetical protein
VFDPKKIYLEFVVEVVTMAEFSLQGLRFFPVRMNPSNHLTHLFIAQANPWQMAKSLNNTLKNYQM